MNLPSFAIAALLSLSSGAKLPQDRAERFAEDFTLATELGPQPFEGPAAQASAVLALIAIAEHEGAHFDPRVERCTITADEGRTVSLFGLMRGASWRGAQKADLCAGGPLPAYLSLLAFAGYARRCRPAPISWFRGYASGSCGVKSDAATAMCSRWETLTRQNGIEGASCWRSKPLRFVGTNASSSMVAL